MGSASIGRRVLRGYMRWPRYRKCTGAKDNNNSLATSSDVYKGRASWYCSSTAPGVAANELGDLLLFGLPP